MELDDPEFLKPAQLAAKMKISVRQVYNLYRRGMIPAVTQLGPLRFKWLDVTHALPSKRVVPQLARSAGPRLVDLHEVLKAEARAYRGL